MTLVRRLGLVIAAACVVGLVLAVTGVFESPPAQAAPSPIANPSAVNAIQFDHTIHVGQYRMQCLDCHVYATQSTVAGLPALRKCMGCHKFVDKQKPAIQALAKLWDEKKPPRWRRVYQLPDYVYFSHEMHLAAKLDCSNCHGNIGSMHQVKKVSSLTMGWCLGCHEKRHATVACIACHK